jgi:uncharacterized protein
VRRFFKYGLLLSVAMLLYASFVEPFRLKIVRHAVTSEKWTAPPMRIVLLTDIHATKIWMTPDHIERIAKRANSLKPDIILLIGDYVATHPLARDVNTQKLAAALDHLSAPCGVYGVWGNHDWQENHVARFAPAFKRTKLIMLENEARAVSCKEARVIIAGLADQWNRRVDVSSALADAHQLPTIVMMHQPDLFPDMPESVALTVAGHTHGGQVRVPFYGALTVPSKFGTKYQQGHYREDGRQMVVSPGLGMSILPIRFNAVPEITVIDISQ